ncbi:dynein assembly factor 3, axonemal-like [Stegodyphus dumicola]|uniref:dynein assembly factor 3, axonemal-like n=1 Tax=Stegodyphus dumicola TaxID=202533 RepID=UPI0015A846F0|nr:dynein assembly factor 3, axonemal-like [Stegodyphus dumicola]
MVYRHLLNFWPLVPAVDMQAVYSSSKAISSESCSSTNVDEPFLSYKKHCACLQDESFQAEQNKKEFNCLIFGDGLGCLIKTMARMFRHGTTHMNLYVAGTLPESLTRTILLLTLFGDSSLSLLERAEMFLEIMGNTFIRSTTSQYIINKSSQILESIATSNLTFPIVSIDHLKQSDIDEIVGVLTYLKASGCPYDIAKAWETALRSYFGPRYDNRINLFDYHFNMKLSDYSIINLKKYLEWRETGIAFKFRKAKYNFPNKTLRIHGKPSANKSLQSDLQFSSSFFGDITTSPYLVFGVESGNRDLFEKANNEYIYTSEDVSKFNVIDFMDEFSSLIKVYTSDNLRIHILSCDNICRSRKFENYFDGVYITCDKTNAAQKLLPLVLKPNGVVLFETIRNVVNSTKEQKLKHSEEIIRLAESSGLESVDKLWDDEGNFKAFILKDKLRYVTF